MFGQFVVVAVVSGGPTQEACEACCQDPVDDAGLAADLEEVSGLAAWVCDSGGEDEGRGHQKMAEELHSSECVVDHSEENLSYLGPLDTAPYVEVLRQRSSKEIPGAEPTLTHVEQALD